MNEWVDEEFESADFGDARLSEGLKRLVERKWSRPEESLSGAGMAEAMAASRFLGNAKVSAEKILAAHREGTLRRVHENGPGRVLMVQDTTECDYTARKKLKGAGPLASPERRGFFAHSHLVLTAERLPLGLWDALIYARDEAEHGKSANCKNRPIEQKESLRWLEGYRHACELAGHAPACEVVSVSDREGDIYEVFAERHQRLGQGRPAAGLLIRSKSDRCLEPIGDEAGGAQPGKLRVRLAAAPVIGTVDFELSQAIRRNKKVKGSRQAPVERSARAVRQEIRSVRLRLKPPHRKTGAALPAVELVAVEAREINPPAGEEPLVWVLLTTLPVETPEQAKEVIGLYLCRWEIELFHKVLKSGCRIEQLQQRAETTLKPAIALCMTVGWRLLYVMRLGRARPDLPCELLFAPGEWKPLVAVSARRGKPAPPAAPTLGEMVLMIAKLGGYLGRKNDAPPGIKAMWIGMTRLCDLSLAWERFGPASPSCV